MMNRLPLRARQINSESSNIAVKVAKLNENGTAKENSHVYNKQNDIPIKPKPFLQTAQDTPDQKKSNDDYSEVIIEERRIGADGEEKLVQRYVRGKLLGKGGFAKVYLCTVPESNKNFAVKIVPKANLVKPRARQKLQAEIRIHKTMKHKHICDFKHYFEDKDNCYIILELCDFQSMNELIKRRKRLTEIETSYFLSQLVNAVNYMHMEQVIHRDLKLGNLFLDQNLHIKVGDFGLAIKVSTPEEKRKTICGTPNYIAPEVIEQDKEKRGHSFEVDIWSMGVICYTLLVGKPPFESRDVQSTYERILSNQYSFPSNIQLSDHAKNLISTILQIDPCRRPSLGEIASHPFLLLFRGKLESLPAFCLHSAPAFKQQRDGTLILFQAHDEQPVDFGPKPNVYGVDQQFQVFDENQIDFNRNGAIFSNDSSSQLSSAGLRSNNVVESVLSKVAKLNLKEASTLLQKNPCVLSEKKSSSNTSTTPLDHGNKLDSEILPLLNLHACLSDAFAHSDLHNQQRKLYQPFQKALLNKWITHHIDYTSKYGLGFLLNDGSVGVYFNDSSKAVLDANGESFSYIDRKSYSCGNPSQRNFCEQYLLSDFPPHLQKKVILLKHFKNYLMEHCEEPLNSSSVIPGSVVYLMKWVRTKHAVFFRLSDNTVQVVFSDNTEIVLCSDGHTLVYVDKAAVRTVYSVESCLTNNSLADVRKRLKYLKDILNQLIESNKR